MTKVAIAAMFAGLWLLASGAEAADLSPGRWPEAQRSELQKRQIALLPQSAREVGGSVLVTGTASPIAMHAGVEALRQGGTAADAAATVALTQIATTLGGTVTYAGTLAFAYFDAKSGKVSFLDANWTPYAGEQDVASIPAMGFTPAKGAEGLGRQTLVPGFMAGLGALHGRFGRLRWAELFEPAIWYADNGVVASSNLWGYLRHFEARFGRTPEGRAFGKRADGTTAARGDLIVQPELSRTLRAVARHGPDEMYRGAWATGYVDTVRAYGGAATMADLARYRPLWRAPLSTRFGDAEVFGMSDGPLACAGLTSLSLVEAMGARSLGLYWRDPAAFRAYARAIQYATLRQYMRTSPTAFERARGLAGATCADRLTEGYAAVLAPELLKDAPSPFAAEAASGAAAGHDTMAIVVVDRRGNVAVLVHSSNGEPTGLVVGGVTLPESAPVNRSQLASVKGGEMVPNNMMPLLALRNGRPVVAIGATATSLMPETVRLMGELLSGHAGLVETVGAPPLLYNYEAPKPGAGLREWPVLIPAGSYDETFRQALAAKGVTIREEPRAQAMGPQRGVAAVAVIDPAARTATGAETRMVDIFAETER